MEESQQTQRRRYLEALKDRYYYEQARTEETGQEALFHWYLDSLWEVVCNFCFAEQYGRAPGETEDFKKKGDVCYHCDKPHAVTRVRVVPRQMSRI